MQRRELVRTGLFGVAAAAAGAAHAAQDAAPAKKRLSENWDVVVVGAGFAGMCAALEAAERGAKTVLLEKMNRPDGATVYSSGWIAAVGSRFQKNHPEDSPKAFFEDMMRLSHQRSDPELIKVYAEESGAGIDWLADHGTPFLPLGRSSCTRTFTLSDQPGRRHYGRQQTDPVPDGGA